MVEERIKLLQKAIKTENIDAFLVSSAQNIFYLTGIDDFSKYEREAYMIVMLKEVFLFTDGRYIHGVKNRLSKKIKLLIHTDLFDTIKKLEIKSLGIEQNITYSEYIRFKKAIKNTINLTDSLIEKLRETKDAEEIKQIKAACNLTDKTFKYIKKFIKLGVTEKEIAWKIEQFIKDNGGELAFDSIVAFGSNSSIPHHKTSNKKLLLNDQFVLLDFGAKINGYHSDMTRTLITKRATDKARRMYEVVLGSQNAVVKAIESGEKVGSKLSEIANDYIESFEFESIPHGLGHSIGLEIHEGPRLISTNRKTLEKGNVFTIEPGIYFPGFGGVRIEDDYYLGDKIEQLTKSPKSLIEI